MPVKTITAAEQKRAAKLFIQLSCVATLLMPLIIPMLLWIAASIFVHASAAHHPNQRVRDYIFPAGYRFYGVVGTLVVILNFSPQMSKWAGGWLHLGLIIWSVSLLIIVVPGIRDILRINKENWQDMTIEVEENA